MIKESMFNFWLAGTLSRLLWSPPSLLSNSQSV